MELIAPFLRFFQSGGLFMYPIALTLILALAVAVERFLYLRRSARDNQRLWTQLSPLLARGALEDAEKLLRGSSAAMARVLGLAFARSRLAPRRSEIEIATEEGLMEVLPAIERRTHYLATFSNMSTLLGLLGTVIGLIGAFSALGAANAAEKADLLSAGISEAMNCTAFGLMVAIPSLLMHAYLQSRTRELVEALEAVSARCISSLCLGPAAMTA